MLLVKKHWTNTDKLPLLFSEQLVSNILYKSHNIKVLVWTSNTPSLTEWKPKAEHSNTVAQFWFLFSSNDCNSID